MLDDAEALLSYADIASMRQWFRSRQALPLKDLQRFTASMVSFEDVDILKPLIRVGTDAEFAGEGIFCLFTRGGVGNLNTIIREWLESAPESSNVTESAPLTLASCVRQLDDGTALRLLFEFADIYDVNVVLQQVLSDADQLPLDRLLRQSLSEQVERLIQERGADPLNRFVWTLRTYVQYEQVRGYLHALVLKGYVSALASYTFDGRRFDWDLLRAVKPRDNFELRLAINLAVDNVRRGASWDDSEARAFAGGLSDVAKTELLDGLWALDPVA